MRIGSLFAGIGGFDLAARWMGWRTAWYSEIDPYACRVMEKNFPGVPNLGDITKITNPPPVDILCGGFPCQDISLAGKGAGIEGERSGLWTHYARLVGEIRPSFVLAENVPALRTRGLDRVLRDLSEIGYDAEWHCIPASAVGAPHRRDRIWILAYPRGVRQPILCPPNYAGENLYPREGSFGGDALGRGSGTFGLVADFESGSGCSLEARAAHRSWLSEPNVGRVADGVPARVDRLRALGNALVPLIPYLIFQAIERYKEQTP